MLHDRTSLLEMTKSVLADVVLEAEACTVHDQVVAEPKEYMFKRPRQDKAEIQVRDELQEFKPENGSSLN